MNRHRYSVKIFYEDTDAAGVVYHANYLRYLDRARSQWLAEMGFELQKLQKAGILFAIRQVHLDYLKPARLGDVLEIETVPEQVRKVSFTCQHVVRCQRDPQHIYCTASVQVASVNSQLKPCRLPQGLIEEIEKSGESIFA